ncbi:MAG: cytidylate kinase-like family protein [Clostridia bacterium]|nr:cytidylate kinase-like family protein [Clostridia bacterium]
MNTIITIGRQYGSGGRELGQILAQKLGIEFYDEELVTMAAEKNNMHKDILKAVDEKATKSLLYTLVTGSDLRFIHSPLQYEMPINDKLFITQSEIIKGLAEKGSCVIVGRCADYVLRDSKEHCIHLFVYADKEKRIDRISHKYDLPRDKAKDRINKIEKSRKSYYNYYSNRDWGNVSNYDMCINTGILGLEKSADLLCEFVKKSLEE